MRVMLIVAYDGTRYCGWQVQPSVTTVEGVINTQLTKLLREEITIIGASRTDSGVHALGNVAVFDTNTRIPAEKISYALNQSLPKDIVIQQSVEVTADFHPRHTNCLKTYEYTIYNAPFTNPMRRLYCHYVPRSLNYEEMRAASLYLIGEHDFASFCSIHTQAKDTIRCIDAIDILVEGALCTIRVRGNGFLYNMVRIIAGTLLFVGLGLKKAKEVEKILEAKDRSKAGPTAPANGLTLIKIDYLTNNHLTNDNS